MSANSWPVTGAIPAVTSWPAVSSWPSGAATPLTIFTTFPPTIWLRSDLGSIGSDQSGNGNSLSPLTGSPTVNASDASLSGLKTLSFAAAQALFRSFSYAPSYTLIVVYKPTAWRSTNVIFGDASARGIADAGSAPDIYQNNTSYVNHSSATLGSWYRVRAKFTNSTSDSMKVGSSAVVTGGNAGNVAATGIGLNLAGGAGLGDFDFFEAIFLPGLSTAGEDTAYDNYCQGNSGSIAI